MTSHPNELQLIWSQLTDAYQRINSTTSNAEKARLQALSDMLRIEYRSLTSTYR